MSWVFQSTGLPLCLYVDYHSFFFTHTPEAHTQLATALRFYGVSLRFAPTPQAKGKIERWHQSLKGECIRPGTPLSLEEARRLVTRYIEHYNNVRLHSAIGYVTPADMLAGRQPKIHQERDHKLEAARQQRQIRRQLAAQEAAQQTATQISGEALQ